MPIKLNGFTSGYVQVQSPDIAGTNTLTLPAVTDTVATVTNPTFIGVVTAPTINAGSSTALVLKSANTTAITIDTSQNVGIGTSVFSGRATVYGGDSYVKNSTSANFYVSETTAGPQIRLKADTTNVGVGPSNAYPFLLLMNNAEVARIDTSGNLLVGYTGSNGSYKLQVNSQIFATSATVATSDGRYKENVTPLTGALALVNALNPVQFSWKKHPVHNFDRSQPTIGFIAQEVQEVLKEQPYLGSIVKSNQCELYPGTSEEFLGIAEGNMIALLTKALQEANEKIDSLIVRIAALELK